MTQKIIKIYKNLPLKISCKAKGFWDYNIIKAYNNDTTEQIFMKTYNGFNYTLKNSDVNPNVYDFTTSMLPNYSYANSQTAVLMPYDNGKIYYNVIDDKNKTLNMTKNGTVDISDDYIASKFTTSNWLDLPIEYRKFNYIYYIKITMPNSLSSGVIMHAEKFLNLEYDNSSGMGVYSWGGKNSLTLIDINNLIAGQTYWIKIKVNETSKEYSYSTNGIDYFDPIILDDTGMDENSSYTFRYGLSSYSKSKPFNGGLIDLKETYITDLDGTVVWSALNPTQQSLIGCLYNYTDTGLATVLNCFYYNDKYLLTADEDIENGIYLGQVEIPKHDVYNYSETSQTVYDNFTIVGSSVTVNQENGQADNFSSSSYLDTGFIPQLPPKTPWKMRVRFKYVKTSSFQVYLSGTTYANAPYLAVGTDYIVDCGISNGSGRITYIKGTTILDDDIYYTIELSYDGNNTYMVRLKRGDNIWNEEATYTTDEQVLFGANLCIGRNGSGYSHGKIDLSTDTYLEIDGKQVWIPTTIHYTGQWIKQ